MPNALIHETSPYLQQHAHNPVQWYAWGDEALNLAQQTNKPILLSIGYSACHWCHVMAHESFADPNTAAIMNKYFINIKVDREERPDLDKIYQLAHNMLLQKAGGWPLTLFLTPDDKMPFFGGTYFPPSPRHGLPAFAELLGKVASFYQQHREQINQQNQALHAALHQYEHLASEAATINAQPLHAAVEQLNQHFDAVHGGFGSAPKFPQLASLGFLLEYYASQAHDNANICLDMALFTIEKMFLSGIYDQVGGGLYRYAVDDLWMIPHFEKMLYDNGSFLNLCVQAFEISNALGMDSTLFARAARKTADWAIREMQSEQGGFYAALDADSEGEEGKFYLWQPDEIERLLPEENYNLFSSQFALDWEANFEHKWHLHSFRTPQEVANKYAISVEQVWLHFDTSTEILREYREQRIKPHRDEKILVAWNALMIKGLAAAGRTLKCETYIQAAQQAVDFIRDNMWVQGRLLATYKDGAKFPAYLDDYAFLLDALIELLQTRWRNQDLSFAIQLAEVLLHQFNDEQQGGLFFTSHQHEELISRPKSYADESMPSGNGVAALALYRLGHLLVEPRFYGLTEQILQAAHGHIQQLPYAHSALLSALNEFLHPRTSIILRGEPDLVASWQQVCQDSQKIWRLCFAIPKQVPMGQDLPITGSASQAEIIAYICTGVKCESPITNLTDFKILAN